MTDTDAKNGLDIVKDESAIAVVEFSVVSTKGANPADESSSNGLQVNAHSETFEFPLEKVLDSLFQPVVSTRKAFV